MISHAKQLILVHIPKTGGTSLEQVFADEESICCKDQWDSRIGWSPLNHLTLNEMIEYEFVSLQQARTYTKVCFVRNPWSRAVSEISYMPGVFEGETFKQKLESLCQMDNYGNHIRPQADFIHNNYGLEMDFIGRFENLSSDYARVCELLGHNRPHQLPHLNSSAHHPYRHYFDQESQAWIESKYQRDIETFGYRF